MLHQPFPIVGIGASAGGVEALEVLFQDLPPNSGMAFVLVTLLPVGYETSLPDIPSSNPPRSARQSAFRRISFLSSRKARQWQAFLTVESLWLRHFRTFSAKTPESLQPNSIKLPFSGDSPWRR
jgi:two-component system CheB/CheR fusion protein